jgi:hypothetical protein
MPAGRFIASRLEEKISEVENMDSRTSKAPSRKHSTGNFEKRVSICFQQNCFWSINLDRNMGQQKYQAALEY